MVSRSRILLFERSFVFFVYDDESQILKWQEDGTSSTQDYIIRVIRELFLPDFYTLSITIFRMIDAQPVAEDSMQTFHDLYSQSDFRQKIEHLLMLFYSFSDKMNIDFRLSAGCHTMKQYNILFHHLHQDTIISILLSQGERFNQVKMRFSIRIQSSYFQFIRNKDSSIDKCLDNSIRTMALIHQFFLGHFFNAFSRRITIKTVPMRETQKGCQGFGLLQGSLHQIERYVKSLLATVRTGKFHIEFHLGFEFLCRFQTTRHGSIIDIA